MYIKDESVNPYGTIKDRRNETIVKEALRLGVDKLTLITSGNNGYSLSKLISETGIKVTCIVGKTVSEEIYKKLSDVAYQVIKINLQDKILRPEEIVSFARERDDEVIWDVTNGYEESYGSVVNEILAKLPNVDYIVVPLGSGGVFVGMAEQLYRSSHNAKIIGIGPKANYDSFADKLSTPWSPYTKAIEGYERRGHTIIRLSESEIRKMYLHYRNICDCEPSASIVFAAPGYFKFKKGDNVVFVNSGNSETVKH
ncbi:MAG: Pyridoxal-5'-phosphate-dependent protein beta subunit [Parcubacteria group bacterium GW2011_GWA1_47_8]|nr:MAG: Pyridoxal-5'-phosphate-dependent protein beta subunit [Parcubacteria group bacterium GW2011_GWA1_47_8]